MLLCLSLHALPLDLLNVFPIKTPREATKEDKGGIITKEGFVHLSNLKNIEDAKGKKKDKK